MATPMSLAGVKSESQLLAFATAAAILDQSHICDLHQRLQYPWILNPLREVRDWTHILMGTVSGS